MLDLIGLQLHLSSLLVFGEVQHLHSQVVQHDPGIFDTLHRLLGLLPIVTLRDVFLEASAEIAEDASGAPVVSLLKDRFHDQQGRDAHKDRGVTALDQLLELRELGLFLKEQLTKFVKLVKSFLFTDLTLSNAPGVFKFGDGLNERLIILELWVNQFDVGLVVAHQHAVSIERTANIVSQFGDSLGVP